MLRQILLLGMICFSINSLAVAEQTAPGAAALETAATEAIAPAVDPAPAAPAPAANPPASTSPFNAVRSDKKTQTALGGGLVKADPVTVIGGLLLVLLLIVAIAWLMRRMGGMASLGGQSMKIVAALSVGTREKVLLIEVGDKQILLGVAPGRVSCLQSFESPVIDSKPAQGSDFSSTIKQLLKQRTDMSDKRPTQS